MCKLTLFFLIDVMGKIVSLKPVKTVQVKGQDRKVVQFRLADSRYVLVLIVLRLSTLDFYVLALISLSTLVVMNLHAVCGGNMLSNWRFMMNVNNH